MLERRTVLLVVKLVRNECVGELVGESPGLAREHCVDVRATLETDHGGALGGHRQVLGRGREPDDVGPVVGEHRLDPRDAQLGL